MGHLSSTGGKERLDWKLVEPNELGTELTHMFQSSHAILKLYWWFSILVVHLKHPCGLYKNTDIFSLHLRQDFEFPGLPHRCLVFQKLHSCTTHPSYACRCHCYIYTGGVICLNSNSWIFPSTGWFPMAHQHALTSLVSLLKELLCTMSVSSYDSHPSWLDFTRNLTRAIYLHDVSMSLLCLPNRTRSCCC